MDEADVVARLARNVVATLGAGHEEVVRSTAASHRQFTDDVDDYIQRVVDEPVS